MRKALHFIPVIVVACTLFACGRTRAQQERTAASTQAAGTTGTRGASASRDDVVTTNLFRNIVKRENPVVVSITTQSRVRTPDLDELSSGDDFFRRFFGGRGSLASRRSARSGQDSSSARMVRSSRTTMSSPVRNRFGWDCSATNGRPTTPKSSAAIR